jgi:hypothetical protein
MNHAGMAKGPAQSDGDDLDEILDLAEVLRVSRVEGGFVSGCRRREGAIAGLYFEDVECAQSRRGDGGFPRPF